MERLAGKRILIVEDEFLIGAMVMEMLSAVGAVIVGPATSASAGMALARSAELDAAILDVNLRGERSDQVAAELQRRNIPYLLATGYGERESAGIGAPVIAKPFTERKLIDGLLQVLSAPKALVPVTAENDATVESTFLWGASDADQCVSIDSPPTMRRSIP